MRFAQLMLFHSMTPAGIAAAAKIRRRYAGDGTTHTRIGQRQICIRVIGLTSTHRQRRNVAATAVHVHHIDVRDVHHVHAIEAASIPRIERIMRSHREPANRSKAKARTMSETNKEDKRRRPQRAVAHIRRARPPAPAVAVIEPATIVIRRPAPRLVTNPRPAVIGLVSPIAVAIRNPAIGLVRNPDIAVIERRGRVGISINNVRPRG